MIKRILVTLAATAALLTAAACGPTVDHTVHHTPVVHHQVVTHHRTVVHHVVTHRTVVHHVVVRRHR